MKGSQSGKLITFFFLYIAQSIPMSFFSTAIPVVLRQENYSLATIGLLQLIKLPWILKFLWAPFVDSRANNESQYKSWIFSAELIYAALIFSVSFLNITADFTTLIILIIMAFLASATQDIATDALSVLSFPRKEKSLAGSIQSIGGFAGTWIGSGLLLILFSKWGWTTLLYCLSAFVLVAMLPLAMRKKPLLVNSIPAKKVKWKEVPLFFIQKGTGRLVLFLVLCYSGLIGILSMLKPMMVDMGYDMKDIGFMVGVTGTLAGCAGSLAGGFIMKYIPRKTARIGGAALILAATLYMLFFSYSGFNTASLYGGVMIVWCSYGMASVILYTTAMEHVRTGLEGTDFTLQTVIAHFSSMIVAIGSGKWADMFGYKGLFILEAVLAFLSLIVVVFLFSPVKKHVPENTSEI